MYYYVVNPAAGRGQIRNLQTKIRSRLDELGIRGEWAKTTGPGEATRMTKAAVASGNYSTIVAVGGDDTVNEVINAVDQPNVAVGVIPLGNTNRLATQLGIVTWPQACEALAARRLTSYSLIAAGQKYFLSTLTIGFETDLDKNVDTSETGWRARTRQFGQSFGQARHYPNLGCHIDVDGRYQLECSFFTLTIANQKFLNPLADNRLIVSISNHPGRNLGLGRFVWQTLRDRSNSRLDAPTTRFLATRVVIETEPATGITVDGKVAGRTPIAIRLTDRRIRLITEKIIADFKDAVSQP